MNYGTTSSMIEASFEKEVLPGLSEFIKIDNLSPFYDLEWNSNGKQDKAAQFILDWVKAQSVDGLKAEIIKDADKSPLIFVEIDARGGSTKNFMLYGHFDKQPHFTGWAEGLGPTIPVIRDGFLYGRGGADDGYAIFSAIVGIKAIQDQGLPHGRVVIVIEGSEESGSPHLVHYLNQLKERIGEPDLMVCLDSGAQDYDRLWVTSSLRGNLIVDITCEVLAEGVHSGAGTGLAPDSFMILRNILDRLEDSTTGRVNSAFQVEIPQERIEDAQKVADLKKEHILEHVKLIEGVKGMSNDYAQLILKNTWEPTLCLTGASFIPPHETAGNVLRPKTTLRLSMRLPPSLDAPQAAEKLIQILSENPPYNAKITCVKRAPGSGWNNKKLSNKLHESLNTTSLKLWGKEYLSFGEGGSIPFIKQLADSFPSCEIVVIGVLGPNSNAHSCNEGLHIDYCKKITATLAHTLSDYSI
jgi:acetylornithine deacetylase/succinyl-diaminopimelate desuccinylase-like protein